MEFGERLVGVVEQGDHLVAVGGIGEDGDVVEHPLRLVGDDLRLAGDFVGEGASGLDVLARLEKGRGIAAGVELDHLDAGDAEEGDLRLGVGLDRGGGIEADLDDDAADVSGIDGDIADKAHIEAVIFDRPPLEQAGQGDIAEADHVGIPLLDVARGQHSRQQCDQGHKGEGEKDTQAHFLGTCHHISSFA
ncbi:MAG: hypothetical protein BWY77_01768 [bacterium ADurb.Bin431]|nr:MAG: hypothetical protein BWY77_01768 [bacterium ADurb.Bin431]